MSIGDTPVPIPNTEDKSPYSAEISELASACENRKVLIWIVECFFALFYLLAVIRCRLFLFSTSFLRFSDMRGASLLCIECLLFDIITDIDRKICVSH